MGHRERRPSKPRLMSSCGHCWAKPIGAYWWIRRYENENCTRNSSVECLFSVRGENVQWDESSSVSRSQKRWTSGNAWPSPTRSNRFNSKMATSWWNRAIQAMTSSSLSRSVGWVDLSQTRWSRIGQWDRLSENLRVSSSRRSRHTRSGQLFWWNSSAVQSSTSSDSRG